MPMIDIAAAQTQFLDLLAAASRGESVTISQDGKPVVQLVAICQPTKVREPGGMEGKIWIADDFDAPMKLVDDMDI